MSRLAALLAGLGLTAAQPPAAPMDGLRQAVERLDRARLEGDVATIEAMTAPDLVLIVENGMQMDRRDFLSRWEGPQVRYESFEVSERYFLALGPDAGVTGGVARYRGTFEGRSFANEIRFSEVFRRSGGRWQVVHIHDAPMPRIEVPPL
jgi:ketosteroid isomerase-like protein